MRRGEGKREKARPDEARQGEARESERRRDQMRRGKARRGKARDGEMTRGTARRNETRREGMAGTTRPIIYHGNQLLSERENLTITRMAYASMLPSSFDQTSYNDIPNCFQMTRDQSTQQPRRRVPSSHKVKQLSQSSMKTTYT